MGFWKAHRMSTRTGQLDIYGERRNTCLNRDGVVSGVTTSGNTRRGPSRSTAMTQRPLDSAPRRQRLPALRCDPERSHRRPSRLAR